MEAIETTVERLPSLSPPADEEIAHLARAGTTKTYCGAPGGAHRDHGTFHSSSEIPRRCPCGAPICATCRDLRRVYRATGVVP